jgi:hypothetical protein
VKNVPEIKLVVSNVDISENISEENGSTTHLPSPNTIVESIKRRMGPPSPTFTGSNPPAFPNSPTFVGPNPFLNSEPIFPEHSHHHTSSTFGPFSCTRGVPKEVPKEGGLIRKGVSRMPIKMRQNSKEDLAAQSQDNQSEASEGREKGTTSQSSEGDKCTPDESEVVDQPCDDNQNSEGSNNSKVIHYL